MRVGALRALAMWRGLSPVSMAIRGWREEEWERLRDTEIGPF